MHLVTWIVLLIYEIYRGTFTTITARKAVKTTAIGVAIVEYIKQYLSSIGMLHVTLRNMLWMAG